MIVESRVLAPPAVAAALQPLGLEASRKGLEMAIDWCFEQKIILAGSSWTSSSMRPRQD